MKSKSYKTTEI